VKSESSLHSPAPIQEGALRTGRRPLRSPAKQPREAPTFTGRVQVPFSFLDEENLSRHLDLFDADATVWRAATGSEPPPAERPYDPFTAWVALAFLGGIERGGPVLNPELGRRERLALAKQVLSEQELLVVETIAVPAHYRKLDAHKLERIIRTDAYPDRVWASCWLTLIGWMNSPSCSFADVCEEYPLGELEQTLVRSYAASQGITDERDLIGWRRICGDYETNLLLHRLTICEVHYELNGPPPYQHTRQSIPLKDGWKQVVRVVPQHQHQ
jgi:hypothetical protein